MVHMTGEDVDTDSVRRPVPADSSSFVQSDGVNDKSLLHAPTRLDPATARPIGVGGFLFGTTGTSGFGSGTTVAEVLSAAPNVKGRVYMITGT